MDNDMQAFPVWYGGTTVDSKRGKIKGHQGMLLRDYFAGRALQGRIANGSRFVEHEKTLAKEAYEMADAMLAEREKEKS